MREAESGTQQEGDGGEGRCEPGTLPSGIPGGAGRGTANREARAPAPNGAADWLRGETITRQGAAALKGQTPQP